MGSPPPGVRGDPSVYSRNTDRSYFRILGKKGEEIREVLDKRIADKRESLGEYNITKLDLKQLLNEGSFLFYTPDGYVEGKPYNPKTDPPIIQNQGATPSPTR